MDLYAGWPLEDQKRFRALANLVGLLCARVELTIGTGASPAFVLGAVQAAMAGLFESLRVGNASPDEQKFFAMVARPLAAEIRLARNINGPIGDKAIFAEFAKLWGIDAKEGEL